MNVHMRVRMRMCVRVREGGRVHASHRIMAKDSHHIVEKDSHHIIPYIPYSPHSP